MSGSSDPSNFLRNTLGSGWGATRCPMDEIKSKMCDPSFCCADIYKPTERL